MKLTKTSVANLTYTGKPTLYFDDEINGFAVRVGSTCKSYQLLYRNKFHVQKVYTIAKTSQCSVQDARETAKKLLAQVIMGEDPQTEKLTNRTVENVNQLVQMYLDYAVNHLKPSTIDSYRIYAARHVAPLIGSMPVKEVRRRTIQQLYEDICNGKTAVREKGKKLRGLARVTGGRTTASRVVAFLGSVFRYAILQEIVDTTPVNLIKKAPERKRTFFLDSEGYYLFGKMLSESPLNPQAIKALRLLAMTGYRRNEILLLKWKYVDFSRQLIRFPDTKTGAQNRHIGLPVVELLKQIKAEQPDAKPEDYVLPGRGEGTHFTDIRLVVVKMKKEYPEFAEFSPHTLRHSFISMGVALHFPDVAIAPLVGHSVRGMTNRYSHTNSAFQIHAANIISTRICELMNGDASLIGKELVWEPNAQGI